MPLQLQYNSFGGGNANVYWEKKCCFSIFSQSYWKKGDILGIKKLLFRNIIRIWNCIAKFKKHECNINEMFVVCSIFSLAWNIWSSVCDQDFILIGIVSFKKELFLRSLQILRTRQTTFVIIHRIPIVPLFPQNPLLLFLLCLHEVALTTLIILLPKLQSSPSI